MKRILFALIAVLFLSGSASATTYYIRLGGGTAVQCTGTVNADYGGSGTGQPCAYKNPMYLVNLSTLAGYNTLTTGDTVKFSDKGPYYIGAGPYLGVGESLGSACNSDLPDCALPKLPNGVSFLGMNDGACPNDADKTVLLGIHGAYAVVSLEAQADGHFHCIAISQPGKCSAVLAEQWTITGTQGIGTNSVYTYNPGAYQPPQVGVSISVDGTTNHSGAFNVVSNDSTLYPITAVDLVAHTITIAHNVGTVAFQAESGNMAWGQYCAGPGGSTPYPYNFANFGLQFEHTSGSQGPIRLDLQDVYIHGMANSGTQGAKFNASSGDVTNLTNLKIYANGYTGFNSDPNGCGTTCESIGTINITNMDAEWNGCIDTGVTNSYGPCTDQAYQGNGDGLVMIATGGTWNWSHVTTKHNTQDCFDSLHSGDDPANLPTINATYLYSEGCEGAAIKMSGGNVTLRNSIGIANCNVNETASNFPLNPAGWNLLLGSHCRAGDAIDFTASNGHTSTVQFNTFIGLQGTMVIYIDIGAGCTNSTCVAIYENNAMLGFLDGDGQFPTPIDVTDAITSNPFTWPSSKIDHNSYFHTKDALCPVFPPEETNAQCADPQFVGESDINNINATPNNDVSPLIANAIAVTGVTTDFSGATRPNPPTIGYLEPSGGLPAANFTANNLVMHAGDQVPPLTYVITGPGYTTATYTTKFTGKAAISTTATSASAAGTYPITITTGTLSSSTYAPHFVAGTMTVIAPDGKGAIINNSVTHPAAFMYDVTAHGVSNTCTGIDQAPAINAILHTGRSPGTEYFNSAIFLYFPAGCYELHTAVQFWGDTVTFEGDGPQTSYFYVPPGFFNSGTNTAVIKTDNVASNENFRIFLQNFGIDIAPGNPNAIGLDYLANNTGSIENIIIWSEDSAANTLLATNRSYDGPALNKNVALYGGMIGWDAAPEAYGATAENLTIQAMQTVGINSNKFPLALRNVLTCMTPTAFATTQTNANVLNSEFLCGGASNTALTNTAGGTLYAAGVTCAGYLHCLTDTTGSVTLASPIVERWSGTAQHLFSGGTAGALPIPANETPLPSDPPVAGWIALGTNPATWTTALATCTSTTAWAPGVSINYSPGSFIPVVIPACINHIIGYNLGYTGDGSRAIQWQINANSATPIIIDRFGAGAFVGNHNSPRTVVMRDGQYGSYAATAGAGDLYMEDVAIIGPTTTILTGQHFWARQLNLEPTTDDKLVCGGPASMWILGYKTERPASSLTLTAGCQTNVYGSLFYPLSGGTTLTNITNSPMFMNWFELVYGAGQGSAHLVTETQGATTLTLNPTDINTSQNLNMYYSGFAVPPVVVVGGKIQFGGTVVLK